MSKPSSAKSAGKLTLTIAVVILLALAGVKLAIFKNQGANPQVNLAQAQAQEQTVVLQNGQQVRGETYDGTEDASIGTRTAHSGELSLENYYAYQRGLLRFDLSSIPPGEVRSATLSLYIKSYAGLDPALKSQGKIDLAIHKLIQPKWDDNKADWNTYDGVNNWKTPGGDFDPNPVSTFTINTVDAFQDLWVNFDVTKLIQEYIDNGTEPNPGMLLKASNKVYPILKFEDTEWDLANETPVITLQPKLEITYFSEAPLANAGKDKGVGRNGVVTLDGTKSSDPNESAKDLIYSWRFLSKPIGSNLRDNDIVPNNTTGNNGADKPKFTVDTLGDYEIELTVTNSLGLSDKDWVRVTSLDIAPHPRIWLTPEKLQTLRQRAQAQTPEWKAFKKVVDTYLANNSNPYAEAGYIYTYALAYLISGDEKYAARALNIMNENIYTFDLPSSPSSGFLGSYNARDYAVYFAVGYDWLYDYLSEEDKVRFYEEMNRWADFYFYDPSYAGSWAVSNPHNNFFYGRVVGGGLTGIATFGDNPRAKEWLDLVRYEKYENLTKPQLITHYKNGGWLYEGSGYGVASYEFLLQYFLGLKTATGENLFRDTSFPEALIYNIIYNTQPPLDRFLMTGDDLDVWEWPDGWLDEYIRILMLTLAEEFNGSTSSEYAQWYLNNNSLRKMKQDYRIWKDLFWYNPNAPERSINDLTINYFDGNGTGYIYGRSDWGKDATWVAFQSGGTQGVVSHQHYDQNSFYIFKRSWLAAPGGLYGSGGSINYNTILVNNGSQDNGQVGGNRMGPGIIERFEQTPDYVYTLGQGANTYNYTNEKYLDNYARQIVYLRPDYTIVFDRIRTANPAYYPKWLLHFVNEPAISGNLTTAVNGQGKMFVKTLSPSDFTINKATSKAGWLIRLTDNQEPKQDYLFLNILQATDTSQSEMIATEQISADSGNMVGAMLSLNANDERVVLFSKTEENQKEVTYTLAETQSQIKHLIADLVPDFTYNIYQDGNLIDSQYVGKDTTIYFTSQGASEFQIKQGDYNPPPTITKISAEPTRVESGQIVAFTVEATDSDGIASYFWNFGDGKNSNMQNPTHSYASAGTYNVRLTVVDTKGAARTDDSITITVTPGPPNDPPNITTFTANPQEGNAPLKVNFSVSAQDPDGDAITSYYWTFGDGQTSQEQNPLHTYTQVNTFTAYVEVADVRGAQTKSDNITIKVNEQKFIQDATISTQENHLDGLVVYDRFGGYRRGLIRFNLSEYSKGQEISSAILSLYIKSYPGLAPEVKSYAPNGLAVSLHKVTQAGWDDKTVGWTKYDGVNNWQTAGGDFDPTPVNTFNFNTVDAFQDLWIAFDVTNLIQEYINQGIEPNPGMLIQSLTKIDPPLTFVDSSSPEISLRPKLEITLKQPSKPNITITKSALVNGQPASQAKTGDIITYTITYKNTGQGEARNIVITDTIPDGTELAEILDNGVLEGNTVRWTIASLSAEQGGSVRLRVRVE